MENKISIEKKFTDYFDFKLFIPVLILSLLGLLSIYSSTSEDTISREFTSQALALGLSIISMLIFMYLPERFLRPASVWLYIIGLILLVAVLLFGKEVYGTKGWLIIAGRSIQPAELSKFAIILLYGFIFSNINVRIQHLRTLMLIIFVSILPVTLIIMQPDVGSASVLIALLIGLLYWSGFNLLIIFLIVASPILLILSLKGGLFFWLGLGVFGMITFLFKNKLVTKLIIIASAVGIMFLAPYLFNRLAPHQQTRINNIIDPGSADRLTTGYNVKQSILTVGSGGLFGKGFKQGTQTQLRYIPMQWTDFIFSVPAEEYGFMGASIVLLLYFLLIIRLLHIASMTKSKFFSIVVFSTLSLFFYHILINIGMVLGITPVMGIPLPFMSYGGTSMIINYSLIGLVLNSYRKLK